MSRLKAFLDNVIENNRRIIITVDTNNDGFHYWLTIEVDDYIEYDDSIELYNYHNDMSLLIMEDMVTIKEDNEFMVKLNGMELLITVC